MKLSRIFRILPYPLVVLFFHFCSTSAFAIPVPDQGQIFGTDGKVSITTDTFSQSITTGISGRLTGIKIQYNGAVVSPSPLLSFSIVDGGNPPVGSTLFTEQLNLGVVAPSDIITWDLTGENLFFTVGDRFTFVIRSSDDSGFYIAGNDPPGYDGGELFRNGVALPDDEVNDIAFITLVDTDPVSSIPEPMPPPSQVGSFNAQEYFPFHPGNQVTYIVNDGVLRTATFPNNTVNVNGTATLPVSFFPHLTEYFTNDDKGLRLHRRDFSNGEIAVLNPPIAITTPQYSVGDIFHTNGIDRHTIPDLGVFDLDFSATALIEAVQYVSVPLGMFTAVRVKLTARETGVVLGQAIDVTATTTLWVAQHYGPVRRIDSDPGFGIFDAKLVAASIDTDEDDVNVTVDNCPAISNPLQTDTDEDGDGDACDTDDDNDGFDDRWEIDNGSDPLDGVCPSFVCRSGSWRYVIPLIE